MFLNAQLYMVKLRWGPLGGNPFIFMCFLFVFFFMENLLFKKQRVLLRHTTLDSVPPE